MKQAYLLIGFIFLSALLFAQSKDSVTIRDSSILKDSLLLKDSLSIKKDSVVSATKAATSLEKYNSAIHSVLKEPRFLNTAGSPVFMLNEPHKGNSQMLFFYLLTALMLFLAAIKFLYARYFNNLFKVFFNTSLRQSQLTDQLLQAKLPSLLFNILFILIGGIYAYLLLTNTNSISSENIIMVLPICVLCLGAIYFLKFLTLKFTGWITGYSNATNTYLFIIFLINKIIGIILVPIVIIMAFSAKLIVEPVIIISAIIIGLMLLLRFFRSYGLLRNQLKVSRFHFFIYIIGIEILPIFIIYKAVMILLSKNL